MSECYDAKIKSCSYLLVFMIFVFPKYLTAQEFQITNVPVSLYSIDRYTNEIYYQNELTEEVFRTNSSGSYNILTEFTSVPQFANNSHIATYIDINQPTSDLYLKDFENDTSYLLGSFSIPISLLYHPLLFSPSDDKILFTGESNLNLIYYSFGDSSIHFTGKSIFTNVMEWLTDSTIISASNYEIISVNINELETDTLVEVPDTVIIRGLSYNENINSFAYSKEYYFTVENGLINLFNLDDNVDTTVYNYLEDGPQIGNFKIFIRSLSWEKKSNKLGFVGETPLVQISNIFAFDYTSLETYLYSDPFTVGDGIKYNLQWIDIDTVIYSDYTDQRFLFGLDVSKPVNVPKDEYYYDSVRFLLSQNYPNPFNPSTKIKFEVPAITLRRAQDGISVTLKVFDVLGREVMTLVNEVKPAGEYEVEFSGTDFPSGIYFYQLRADAFTKTKKMILLK